MNWYKDIKIAQIWNTVPYDEFGNEFELSLQSLYELEYKWSMINQRPFSGLEQRRQNISEYLRSNLNEAADNVKGVLSNVFNKWLSSHAILDPATWARSRVDEMGYDVGFGEMFDSMLDEHMNYSDMGNQRANISPREQSALENNSMRKMLQFAMENIDTMPYFKEAFDNSLVGYRDMLQSELDDEGLEEFSERYGKEFKNEEEAESYIENISIDDVDIDSLYYFEDAEEFSDFISEAGDPEEILIEFYEKTVFPLWYEHWQQQGIDETRDTIEEISSRLENANAENTQEFMAAVNMALNAAHQTGAMTDYIEQDTGAGNIEGVLSDLSSGTFVPEWDKELREVGVQV